MPGPDPREVAHRFQVEVREALAKLPRPVRLVGLLTQDTGPSRTYAEYTRAGCEAVGAVFDLRQVERLKLEAALADANADPAVHGVLVYYPVFGTEQDRYLKDLIDWRKDVEGLSAFWVRRLYANERFVDAGRTQKSVLPCTPLAVVKMLEAAGALDAARQRSAEGLTVTVFNRSEVVGRPLATMLANDGARVYSFDVDGPLCFEGGALFETSVGRTEALAQSDVVITGVPSASFELVRADELKPGAACLNFSTRRNFAPEVEQKARVFIPRVGPVTVAMCLRNLLRLYTQFQQGAP